MGRPVGPGRSKPAKHHNVWAFCCAISAVTAIVGLGPVVAQSLGATAAAATGHCSAPVSGTALNRSAWTASTNTAAAGGDVAPNAIDGNLTTRFSSDAFQASGQYWQANMGSPQSFDELQMQVPNSPGDWAKSYNVEVSSDGTNWATVASCTGTGDPEIVSFPTRDAQYVRVVQTGSSSSNWWSIDELN